MFLRYEKSLLILPTYLLHLDLGPRPGVSKLAPGGPLSFKVCSNPLNAPESANQGLTRHTRNFQAGVLRQVGAKFYRTVALQDRVWRLLS